MSEPVIGRIEIEVALAIVFVCDKLARCALLHSAMPSLVWRRVEQIVLIN